MTRLQEVSDTMQLCETVCDIIDAEPSIYEEVDKKKGKDTMIKEPSSRRMMSIMRCSELKGIL